MSQLERVRRYIYNCRRCGVCGNKVTEKVPYVCPVKENTSGFEHFYARGKNTIALGLLEKELSLSPGIAEAAYSCTMCGNCVTQCASTDQKNGDALVRTAPIVEAMRADLLTKHPQWVPQAYHAALAATRNYDNPWGVPRNTKEKWTRNQPVRDIQKDTAEILLFAGCTMPSQQKLSVRLEKAAAVLNRLGADFAVLGKNEPCCGSVQRRIGAIDYACEIMEKNISLFNGLGCKKIVTLCAGCYHTLKNEYRESKTALDPQVMHITEFLAECIPEIKSIVKKPPRMKLAYHDPCHLGRHMGVYEQPRTVLQAFDGVELVERTATRENTICCGAGAGMRLFQDGSIASAIGRDAVGAACDAGAEALVSACPFCEMNLEAGAQQQEAPFPVYDIIDIVYEGILQDIHDD